MIEGETMTKQEWLEKRRTGIGGSDVAAILGLNPWVTPLQVYQNKKGLWESEETPSMDWGTRLEPVIRQKYCDVTGNQVSFDLPIFEHPEHKFMHASIDGLVMEEGNPAIVLECKTARTDIGWGDPGTDQIPEYYQTQVQHYMTVLNVNRCDVAVLIGGSDFRIYHVSNNPELAELLIEEEKDFWENHVLKDIPPEPRTAEDLQMIFPQSNGNSLEVSDEQKDLLDAVKRYSQNRAQISQLEKTIQEDENLIKKVMGDNEILNLKGKKIFSWKSTKPTKKFDLNRFKKEEPETYGKYMMPAQSSRRFCFYAKGLEE